MQANKTVTINGRQYDAVTGLPVETKSSAKPRATATKTASTSVHSSAPQKSQTLRRRSTKKPGVATPRKKPGQHMDISRSASVSRFASHPAPVKPAAQPAAAKAPASVTAPVAPVRPARSVKKVAQQKPVTTKPIQPTADRAPQTHPVAARAAAKVTKPIAKPVTAKPAAQSKQVKNEAIKKALAPTPKPEKPAKVKKEKQPRWSRRATIVTAIFALLIIGAGLTYLNMPSLSVGIAAAQAGIKATYPEYKPNGYSLSQPVEFSDKEVILTFKSNAGTGSYKVIQSGSTWDSSAVLENIVRENAGDNYITTQERGLTIYSYEAHAVWVNGGILYQIDSDAPLSGEQIRRIATSL